MSALHLAGRLGSTLCGREAARVRCTADLALFGRVAEGKEPLWSGPSNVCETCAGDPMPVLEASAAEHHEDVVLHALHVAGGAAAIGVEQVRPGRGRP